MECLLLLYMSYLECHIVHVVLHASACPIHPVFCRRRADEKGTAPSAFVKLIEDVSRDNGRPHILNVQNVRLVIRELRRFRQLLGLVMRPPQTLFKCAACVPDMAVMCMDGIFKLFRYERNFAPWRQPVVGLPGALGSFFADPETVKTGLDWVEQTLASANGPVERTCGAAEIDALRGKTHAGGNLMANSALYACSCAHSILYKAFDFSGGEKFSLSILMYMLVGIKPAVICGDTMCRVQAHFTRLQGCASQSECLPCSHPDLRWNNLGGTTFRVNALHVMGVRPHASASTCASNSVRLM